MAVYACMHMCVYVYSIYVYTYTCTHTQTHTYDIYIDIWHTHVHIHVEYAPLNASACDISFKQGLCVRSFDAFKVTLCGWSS